VKTLRHKGSVHVALIVLLAGLLAVPLVATPAAAEDQNRRGQIEIRGIVVSVDWHSWIFHVDARGSAAGRRVWAVRVDRQTDFEVRRRGRNGDNDRRGRGFRRVTVGDGVEVEGRLIGNGIILAREVEVFDRDRFIGQPPYPYPQPPYGQPPYGQPPYSQPYPYPQPPNSQPYPYPLPPNSQPYPYPQPPYGQPPYSGQPPYYGQPPYQSFPAPVISFPTAGSVVNRRDFLVSGRTLQGAQVVIQVAPVYGPVTMQPVTFQTMADQNGFFSAALSPAQAFPRRGMQYQISVIAHYQGVQSPAATLTVRAD